MQISEFTGFFHFTRIEELHGFDSKSACVILQTVVRNQCGSLFVD